MIRRQLLLAGAGLTGAALAAPRHAPARTVTKLDLKDPRTALESYVKLRGSLAEETVFQPYEGDIFLVANGQLGIPLCGFHGLQKSIWRHAKDGGYVNTDFDIGFYLDYQSREVLKTWKNPLTAAEVEVFHYRSGPSGGRFSVGGRAGDVYGDVAGRWSVCGEQIWHTSAHWSERPNPLRPEDWPKASAGETILGSMSLTFAGRTSEVADPAVQQAPSLQVWTNTSSWMPWMEMGQRPGFNLWRWVGAKGTPTHLLDSALVTAVERVCPGYVLNDSVWRVPTSGRQDYMRQKTGLELTR